MVIDYKEREKRRIEWLASLKAGDMVGYYAPHMRKAVSVMVERVTPTLVVIGYQRFSKKNGYAIGQHATLSRSNIVEITDEIRDQIEHNTLLQWANSLNWNAFPLETLRAMKKAHDEAATGQCLKGDE